MATKDEDKKQNDVVKKIDSGRGIAQDKALDESTSRDISKMQAPVEWPDPPKDKKSEG